MSDLAALVVQQSVNGVYLGCLYVMVALGLTLIYGVLNQINFAHADFVTVGAFAAFFTATRFATKALGLPDAGAYLLSLIVALGVGAVLGLAVNAAVFAPLRRGEALRAVAQDRETAGLMGINPNLLIALTIVIASALAGMAGALLGPVLVLTPFAGATVIVKAFAIVIIGGFGNMQGTILAGILVGIIEAFTVQYLGSGLIDLVVFVLLLVMLVLRPTGLIAERKEENV